jgi:predicted Zn-dependent protease
MLLNDTEGKKLAERLLGLSKADETAVIITGGPDANTRFAANSVTTSGYTESLDVTVECRFGKRRGTANTSDLSDAGIAAVVRNAEEVARLAPEDPELQPLLGPQKYTPIDNYSEKTAQADAVWRAQVSAACLKPARAQNLIAAGFVENRGRSQILANSRGLFGYHRNSSCSFSATVRTSDGTGSGWAEQVAYNIDDMNGSRVAERAIEKAIRSQKPEALDPGQYTVILEPSAVASLINFISFDARSADEGRSFISKKDGTRLGEALFHESVNIYTDPASPIVAGAPFDLEGQPAERIDYVRRGVLENLNYSRYWAARTGKRPTPAANSLVMDGGKTSVEEMIKSTKRGILVTHFWYIRLFDPQTLLLTGLTRDGTFLIEEGAIKRPIKNFRFNESPIALLRNIEALSPAERVSTTRAFPAVKAHSFTFSSLSDAI